MWRNTLITVVIRDNGEPNVIKLTYENLWKELKNIPGADLLVAKNWFDALSMIKTTYVCFVESDCLVNSGYFSSQLGLIKKNPMFRKLSMLTSSTCVNDWAVRFFGYTLGNDYSSGITPIKDKKSNQLHPVQIGYVPGAVIRTGMLKKALDKNKPNGQWENLVYMSAKLSLAFWSQGDGNPVFINPNASYVTTEDYVNDISPAIVDKGVDLSGLANKFKNESI